MRIVALTLAALAVATASASAQGLLARDATIRPVTLETEVRAFPFTQPGGAGSAEWTIVEGSGNCCENYVTTTPAGRILDFGGSYVNYSDDRGATWSQVLPDTPRLPIANGEGAIVAGPNGDVLGVGWDPYSGDELLAFKYDAAAAKWRWQVMPLKTPFYDREWIAVVPGPVQVDGETVPYVAFVKGGYPSKEGYLYSTDGLEYTSLTSRYAGSLVDGALDRSTGTDALPYFDATQSNTNMGLTPLAVGRALASPDSPMAGWTLLKIADGGFEWQRYEFPTGEPEGIFQIDSRGRLHNVIPGDGSFEYRLSSDGGLTFASTEVDLPAKHTIEEIDLRASAALELGAVAIHGHDRSDGADQDLLFKLDTTGGAPALMRTYMVGAGDVDGSSGVGADVRFDFETLALLPDGRVVMSFYDKGTDATPALAIERSEPLSPRGGVAVPSPSGPGPAPPSTAPGAATDAVGPAGGRHRVTLAVRRSGRRLVFTGRVLPRHPGHRVLIQRRARGRSAWTTISRVRAGRASTFRASKRLRARRGDRFRAIASADSAGHKRGTGRVVAVSGS